MTAIPDPAPRQAPDATALCIFARPAVAGRAKTRLIPSLGAEGAARLYAAFLEDTLRCARRVPALRSTVWVAGSPGHPSLDSSDPSIARRRQPERRLGERLHTALTQACATQPAAIVVGSDAPTLPPRYLERAALLLRRTQLVLGPTADGGFYALGVQRAGCHALAEVLSQVRWSSDKTLTDTVAAAQRAGLRVAFLPPWYDVDDARDLRLLRLHLALCPEAAPASARALAAQPAPAPRRHRAAAPL